MVKLGTPLHGPMLLLSRCVWGKTAHSEPTRLAFFSRDDIKKRAFKSVSSLSSTWYFIIEHFLSSSMSSRDDRILLIFAQAQVPINLCVCLRLVRRVFFSSSSFLKRIHVFWGGTLYDTLPFFDNKKNLLRKHWRELYKNVYLCNLAFHERSKKTDRVFACQTEWLWTFSFLSFFLFFFFTRDVRSLYLQLYLRLEFCLQQNFFLMF